jgi:hypothetical protein
MELIIMNKNLIELLKKIDNSMVGPPRAKAHINIPNTLKEIEKAIPEGLVITQKDNEIYVVYNGLAKNIKARAREHYYGHDKTYCLCLKHYKKIWEYDWYFYYYKLKLEQSYLENKMYLKIIEQAWRAKNGWPMLCRQ